MRWPLFFVGLLLLIRSFPSACADPNVKLPSPTGFIDGAAVSQGIRDIAKIGLQPWQKLAGFYLPPDVLADILNSGQIKRSPFCKALIDHEYKTAGEAVTEFRKLKASFDQDTVQKIDRDDPEIDRILRHYEDAAKQVRPDAQIRVDGATILGMITESENYFAGSELAVYVMSDDGQPKSMPVVLAFGELRIGSQLVNLSVIYPFRGKASIEMTNGVLLDWLNAVVAAN